jgi:amino acid transporter
MRDRKTESPMARVYRSSTAVMLSYSFVVTTALIFILELHKSKDGPFSFICISLCITIILFCTLVVSLALSYSSDLSPLLTFASIKQEEKMRFFILYLFLLPFLTLLELDTQSFPLNHFTKYSKSCKPLLTSRVFF